MRFTPGQRIRYVGCKKYPFYDKNIPKGSRAIFMNMHPTMPGSICIRWLDPTGGPINGWPEDTFVADTPEDLHMEDDY